LRPGSLNSNPLPNAAAAERGGNNLRGFKDVRTEHGSTQGQILAVSVLYVPDSSLVCLICARFWPCLSDMYQILAESFLYVPDSGRVFLICARFWPCLSYVCQIIALSVLYVPDTGLVCLICARLWRCLSYMCEFARQRPCTPASPSIARGSSPEREAHHLCDLDFHPPPS